MRQTLFRLRSYLRIILILSAINISLVACSHTPHLSVIANEAKASLGEYDQSASCTVEETDIVDAEKLRSHLISIGRDGELVKLNFTDATQNDKTKKNPGVLKRKTQGVRHTRGHKGSG